MKGSNTGMEKKYSWKRMEEPETDLADLLYKLCRQWKQMAVCALVAAFILGGYGWLKARGPLEEAVTGTEDQAELTEAEEQGVADAVRLENEIRGLESYLDHSVLMQLDPYHKCRVVMLFRIDQAKRQELPAVTESYLNFILNGGAADELEKLESWKMDKSCIAELISAYQKTYSFPYQILVNSEEVTGIQMDPSLFYVEITGRDTGTAKKMAAEMQDVLEKYSASAARKAGSHRLELVSSAESVTADSGLQSQQHDKKNLLSSSRTSLKAMTDAFNEKQMEAYKEAAGIESKEGKEELSGEGVPDEGFRPVLKYGFLGLAGGIFVYGCIYVCWYLLRDTVKSEKEMKELYTFSFYGSIPSETQACAQLASRIRLACRKQGISRLCAASDFLFGSREKECLEHMAEQMEGFGIHIVIAENAGRDPDLWDTLTESGNVLMVCRIGTTTHQMIDDAMTFYGENGIHVMGAMAFDQNRYRPGRPAGV